MLPKQEHQQQQPYQLWRQLQLLLLQSICDSSPALHTAAPLAPLQQMELLLLQLRHYPSLHHGHHPPLLLLLLLLLLLRPHLPAHHALLHLLLTAAALGLAPCLLHAPRMWVA
jgi:hypothetical protein